jgi:hypothetical protein
VPITLRRSKPESIIWGTPEKLLLLILLQLNSANHQLHLFERNLTYSDKRPIAFWRFIDMMFIVVTSAKDLNHL